jgi:hypothetical protein
VEATLWRIKAFAGWVGAFVAAIIGYLTGFELLTRFISNQTAVSIIATAYLTTFFFIVIIFTAVRQWIAAMSDWVAGTLRQHVL